MKVLCALILSVVVCGQAYGQGPRHPTAGVGTGGTGSTARVALFGVGTGGTGYRSAPIAPSGVKTGGTGAYIFGVGTGGTGDGTGSQILGVGTGGTGDTAASFVNIASGGLLSFIDSFYSAMSN